MDFFLLVMLFLITVVTAEVAESFLSVLDFDSRALKAVLSCQSRIFIKILLVFKERKKC